MSSQQGNGLNQAANAIGMLVLFNRSAEYKHNLLSKISCDKHGTTIEITSDEPMMNLGIVNDVVGGEFKGVIKRLHSAGIISDAAANEIEQSNPSIPPSFSIEEKPGDMKREWAGGVRVKRIVNDYTLTIKTHLTPEEVNEKLASYSCERDIMQAAQQKVVVQQVGGTPAISLENGCY